MPGLKLKHVSNRGTWGPQIATDSDTHRATSQIFTLLITNNGLGRVSNMHIKNVSAYPACRLLLSKLTLPPWDPANWSATRMSAVTLPILFLRPNLQVYPFRLQKQTWVLHGFHSHYRRPLRLQWRWWIFLSCVMECTCVMNDIICVEEMIYVYIYIYIYICPHQLQWHRLLNHHHAWQF